jgi:hypothetical protein
MANLIVVIFSDHFYVPTDCRAGKSTDSVDYGW